MQTQTVEIIGFTREDQPMKLRKVLEETGLLRRVSLVIGVRVTTTSIIDSGRLGDPQNSAPPVHQLPSILRAIREAGFERAVVWVPPKQHLRQFTPEYARMVYLWGKQAGSSTYQVMAPSPLTPDVSFALSALEAVDREIQVKACPPRKVTGSSSAGRFLDRQQERFRSSTYASFSASRSQRHKPHGSSPFALWGEPFFIYTLHTMLIDGSKNFSEFELIDSGHGRRLERWGTLTLVRPDPQAIWKPSQDTSLWDAADAVFEHDAWNTKNTLPEQWELAFQSMKLIARPMSFKHTGIFPEQAHNWLWMQEQLRGLERPRVLNLFGYTGAATVWLTMQGAFVTHVDSSRPALGWARENQRINNLSEDAIRWMLEDAVAFVRKEVRRGAQYEGIVMDPPAFGHGPSGGMWKFNVHMPGLLESCVKLLSPEARFLLINAYATNSSELALQYVLQDAMGTRPGNTDSGQLCLGQRDGRLVSVGIWSHWTK